MGKHTPSLPGFKPPTKRVKTLVRRCVRERTIANQHHAKAREALAKARGLGLAVGQQIDVDVVDEKTGQPESVPFYLRNNFDGDQLFAKGRYVDKFELVRVPKAERSEAAQPAEA
ncbi:MAG: hypothetical protein ACJ74Y_10720 [Bryobacteraceae bacterium]